MVWAENCIAELVEMTCGHAECGLKFFMRHEDCDYSFEIRRRMKCPGCERDGSLATASRAGWHMNSMPRLAGDEVMTTHIMSVRAKAAHSASSYRQSHEVLALAEGRFSECRQLKCKRVEFAFGSPRTGDTLLEKQSNFLSRLGLNHVSLAQLDFDSVSYFVPSQPAFVILSCRISSTIHDAPLGRLSRTG